MSKQDKKDLSAVKNRSNEPRVSLEEVKREYESKQGKAERTKGEWKVNEVIMGQKDELLITNGESYIATIIPIMDINAKQAEANAQFICKAVNAHDKLVEALKDIINCQFSPTKSLANLNGAIGNAQTLLMEIETPQ